MWLETNVAFFLARRRGQNDSSAISRGLINGWYLEPQLR
jgi:hypothetical protein